MIKSKYQENYSVGYHYSLGFIQKLFEAIENPFEGNKQFDSVFIHEYITKWITLVKEY